MGCQRLIPYCPLTAPMLAGRGDIAPLSRTNQVSREKIDYSEFMEKVTEVIGDRGTQGPGMTGKSLTIELYPRICNVYKTFT